MLLADPVELWSEAPDSGEMFVRYGAADELNPLLSREHYLGPLKSGTLVMVGVVHSRVVAGQVWRPPTSRRLPADGSWLELSRWCLTPAAGANAGSRFHRQAVQLLRSMASVTTLVSYSDPSHGHTGALYAACNWLWSPTWVRLRPPPSGQGSWRPGERQSVKDRWIFPLRKDQRRADVCAVGDLAAIRNWLPRATATELRRALQSPAEDLVSAVRAYRMRGSNG